MRRIVLIGFMGAGKSTVGRTLAERLGWAFKDMDALIEERHGRTVADIFKENGEPFFRQEEMRLAGELRGVSDHVIAAGGGAFAQPSTREALREGAGVVWLQCSLDAILRRVAGDASRPLATGRERMQALLVEREASYRLADLVVDTTDTPPDEVAARIVKAFFPGRGPQGGTER